MASIPLSFPGIGDQSAQNNFLSQYLPGTNSAPSGLGYAGSVGYGGPASMYGSGLLKASQGMVAPPAAGGTSADDIMKQALALIGGQPQTLNDYANTLQNNNLVNSTYNQIDQNTNNALGSQKLDMLQRGIGGPNQNSDIEQNALAAIRAGGANSKAQAQTALTNTQLGNMQQQGLQTQSLLGGLYGNYYSGTNSSQQNLLNQLFGQQNLNAQIGSNQLMQDKSLANAIQLAQMEEQTRRDLLTGQINAGLTEASWSDNQAPNPMDSLFNNITSSAGASLGSSLGSGASASAGGLIRPLLGLS